MENLPTGTDITVVFGYDIKHGGKHALDYLTHFARLDPHLVNFGHGPEMVTPKSGVSGISATTMTFPIPAPSSVSSCASDVGDQPATSFNALPAGQRLMTLFGGTITNVLYDGAQGCLTDAQAETQIAVSFTVVNPTAVLAWGGHIAKATDWGPGNSAGAISGSPFHMRLISWSLGNLGHQDRSLSAGAVISPGAITIVKDATPVGSTSFSFTGSPVPLTNFSLVDDGSATDTKVFSDITNFTTYTVTENTPPGWDLTGIGCVVAGENGGSQDINGATVTIDLKEGENVTCTFANTQQQGDLIVIKHVINDDGGTAVAADWTMDITGTNVSSTGFAGEEAPGVTVTLDAGAYSVDESGDPSGYTKSQSADCSGTIAAGETKTCTITNDDVAPTLKLVKEVINLDGGDAGPDDWTLTAISTGGDATRDISTLGGSGGFETVFANAVYDLAESPDPLTGYTTGSFSCVGGTQSGSTITLAEGETGVICTITNDDVAPTLKLVKEVINLDGGDAGPDDWTLTAISTGGDATRDISTLGGSGGFETVFANAVYDLAESPDPLTGYTTGSFSCVGGTQSGSTITLAEGETGVICTITNDDVAPTLKLVKEVINLDGGDAGPDDWTLTAISTGGDATRDISTLGGSGGFETVFANAVYDLAESPDPLTGYTTGSFSCVGGTQSGSTITLAEGETGVICTITNDDVAPTLKLVKEVINLDGGDAGPDDWTLTAISTGGDATRDISTLGGSGVFETVFANVGYDLSETGLAGYTAGSFSCVGGTLVGSTVTLTEGETGVVCTITNDDIPGTLIIQKVAVGIGLQTAEFDFEISPPVGAQFTETISVSGGGVQGQAAFTLSGLALGAPPHTVTELALPVNWVFTSLNCSLTGSGAGTSTFSTSGQTATVTLVGAGDTVTCVYTNTHVATRATQGFWSTHLNVMSNGQSLMNIISAIGLQLCGNPARVVDMVPELMGGFWSRISRTAGPPKGTRRNPLDQARMQLIQQLLAAVLNNHVFGADDEGAITAGEAAYCGTNRGAIIMAADALATFNESGGSAPFPDGFEQGSADPKTARSIADRPFWDMLP